MGLTPSRNPARLQLLCLFADALLTVPLAGWTNNVVEVAKWRLEGGREATKVGASDRGSLASRLGKSPWSWVNQVRLNFHLEKSHHVREFVTVERYGTVNHIVVCKRTTEELWLNWLKKYSQRSCWFHYIITSKLPLLLCVCVCGWYVCVCVCVSRAVCSTVTAGRSVCQHIRLVNGEHTPERVCVCVGLRACAFSGECSNTWQANWLAAVFCTCGNSFVGSVSPLPPLTWHLINSS